ncbi:MAG TPA: hypothetical protein PLY36_13710 [Spirochaetota bacterium]|nr:hypothetical protein [Spirochaetota bacterium]
MKYLKITLLILIFYIDTQASGIFNLGLMAGAASDAGNVEKIAGDINLEMREYQAAHPGTSVTEIETTYSPVFSANLAYINDDLLIKLGWEYTSNVLYNPAGSIKPSGLPENKVELDYSRFTFPVSFGIVIPLSNRSRFYFAGGLNMSYVLVKVKQSNPAALTLYPDESNTFSAFVAGTHLKCGAETLIDRNYSFVMELTRYFGNPAKIKSENENSEIFMSVNSFEITAGINYNLDFKI